MTPKKVLHNQDCELYNLVYLITCNTCLKQYVGETKRTIRVRLKEHLADIKHSRDSPMANHFNARDHAHFTMGVTVIDLIKGETDNPSTTSWRRSRESYWIHQLRSLKPLGINDHV